MTDSLSPTEFDLEEELNRWRWLRSLIHAVLRDVSACMEAITHNDTPLARRGYVRATFAAIEGVTWAMKLAARENARTGHVTLSPAELAMLAELA